METEFRIARESLNGQFNAEVLALRDYLKDISEEDLDNPKKAGEVISAIYYTNKGIEKIAHAMEYVDAWEENGDPPQFSYTKE